jgi:N-acetylglucosamine malate deacetylase 1
MDRILIVVAHGDDETLGAGGTIAKLTDAGAEVALCVFTHDDGARAADGRPITDRTAQIQSAASILGIKRVHVDGFGDSRLDSVSQLELNRVVEQEIRDFAPDVLYTTSSADLSVDHQLVSRAARVAGRPGRSPVREIRCFEVRSATDCAEASGVQPTFRPTCWQVLDESHLERKLEALRAYGREVEPWPHPRSERGVRALAEYRGSQVAVRLAEAFELVRLVQ